MMRSSVVISGGDSRGGEEMIEAREELVTGRVVERESALDA